MINIGLRGGWRVLRVKIRYGGITLLGFVGMVTPDGDYSIKSRVIRPP